MHLLLALHFTIYGISRIPYYQICTKVLWQNKVWLHVTKVSKIVLFDNLYHQSYRNRWNIINFHIIKNISIYIRVGKTESLGPWRRVIVYCSKLSFCQNDTSMGESFWQKKSLLQYTLLRVSKDQVLPTLIYIHQVLG